MRTTTDLGPPTTHAEVVDENGVLHLRITDDMDGSQYTEPMLMYGWVHINDTVEGVAYFKNTLTGQSVRAKKRRELGSLSDALFPDPEENARILDDVGW